MSDAQRSPATTADREIDRAVFSGGAVVQLAGGDSDRADAEVTTLMPATVKITDRRVVAVTGGHEWSWLLSELESVSHGVDGPWSIFAVPGVDDFGVAVQPADLGDFRRRLDQVVDNRASATQVSSNGSAHAPVAPPADTRDPEPPTEPVDVIEVINLVDPPPLMPAVAPASPTAPDPDPRAGPVASAVVLDAEADPAIDVVDAVPSVSSETPGAAAATAGMPTLKPTRGLGRLRSIASEGAQRLGARSTAPRANGQLARDQVGLAGLHAREISAWFGTHHVLDRVSLEMEAGRVTTLIGPSGCGKSTFLRILNRMHEMIPSAALGGEVLLDGVDIYDASRRLTDARRQIGMVFQKPNPFPAMSIYDNVVASFRLTGMKVSAEEKDDVVESCLRKAGLWTEVRERLRQPGGGLSGGQQQRLCIARALAIRHRVLLMDEPCSALDPTSTRQIEQTIAELADEVTIVIVTHNMQQAARVSHKSAFFLAEQGTPGVIVEHGPTDAMFNRPQDSRTNDYVNGRFG